MTHEAFTALLEQRITAMRATLGRKANEYATGADRLHNFKQAAGMLRGTPAQACAAFMTKHLVSVFDMVDQVAKPSADVIDEKIGDAINYLVLLEAILKETPVGK